MCPLLCLFVCRCARASVCDCVCLDVLVKRSSCSVFPTPHCDAEAPDWAMTHHGLSVRSLRSDTKEYRQTEWQRDIPEGTGLTSAWIWAWNPAPGRSHSTEMTSDKINHQKGRRHRVNRGVGRNTQRNRFIMMYIELEIHQHQGSKLPDRTNLFFSLFVACVRYWTPKKIISANIKSVATPAASEPHRSFGCKSAVKRDGRTRQHSVVITQNACYINKLRSCFQFEANYMVLTGHWEKHRSQGRLVITPARLSVEAKCCHSAVISQMSKVGGR